MVGLWIKRTGLVKGKKHALSAVSLSSNPTPVRSTSSQEAVFLSHWEAPRPSLCLRKECCLQMFIRVRSVKAEILQAAFSSAYSSHHVHIYHQASASCVPRLMHPSWGPKSPTVVVCGHKVWSQSSTRGERRSARCWFAWAECWPSNHDLTFPRVYAMHKVSSNSGTQWCYCLLRSMLRGHTLQTHAFGLNSQ